MLLLCADNNGGTNALKKEGHKMRGIGCVGGLEEDGSFSHDYRWLYALECSLHESSPQVRP
jgi:hypothetical protein